MLKVEADIARERICDIASRDAVLMHTVITQVMAGGNRLNEEIERMRLDGLE
jgi:hypothetical protein